jgi:hypothetical protein
MSSFMGKGVPPTTGFLLTWGMYIIVCGPLSTETLTSACPHTLGVRFACFLIRLKKTKNPHTCIYQAHGGYCFPSLLPTHPYILFNTPYFTLHPPYRRTIPNIGLVPSHIQQCSYTGTKPLSQGVVLSTHYPKMSI